MPPKLEIVPLWAELICHPKQKLKSVCMGVTELKVPIQNMPTPLPTHVRCSGSLRQGRAGQNRGGQGRTGQGKVHSYLGVIMSRALTVQVSAIVQCCSCDMRPEQNGASPANSRVN